jgi:hypothetical protein
MTALATVEDRDDLAEFLAETTAPELAHAVQHRDADKVAAILAPLSTFQRNALLVVLAEQWPLPHDPMVRPEDGVVDEVTVARVAAGHRAPLTRVERDLVIHLMRRRGVIHREIADHLGLSLGYVAKVAKRPLPVQTDLFDEDVTE